MSLRKLKQSLGFQAARHGSERLFAQIGGNMVQLPLDANVLSFPELDLLYIGLPRAQSSLFRHKNGEVKEVQEEEAEEISQRLDDLLNEVVARNNAVALAKVNAAVAEASRDLPSGWRIAVGPDGKARTVRSRPEAPDVGDLVENPAEHRSNR